MYQNNVLQGTNPWVFTNAYGATNTSDNLIRENWYNSGGAQTPNATQNRNQLVDNVQVTGTNWPAAAQQVICEAGVEPDRRTVLNGNFFSEDPACGNPGDAVAAPFSTTGSSAVSSYFAQSGDHFGIRAAGADVWGGGGQRDDQYGAIFQKDAVTAASTVSARVDTVGDSNAWAKSGVMIRNDIEGAGASAGYAVVAVTPRNGVAFHWDANGDGYVESSASANVNTFRPIWVKLERQGDKVSAFYSYDGANYAQVGSTVTLTGAEAVQDGGMLLDLARPQPVADQRLQRLLGGDGRRDALSDGDAHASLTSTGLRPLLSYERRGRSSAEADCQRGQRARSPDAPSGR